MGKLTIIPKVAAQGASGVVIVGLYIFFYLLFIGAVITGGLAVYNHVTGHFHNAGTSSSTSPANQPYVAIKDNFKISFPSTPTIQNTSIKILQSDIPATEYNVFSGNKGYLVAAYTLPNTSDFQFSNQTDQRSFLQQWVNGTAGTSNGVSVSIVTSSFITFRGYDTAFTYYSATGGGTTSDEYQYVFLKGSTIYNIVTIGYPVSTFNTFADSFQLTN